MSMAAPCFQRFLVNCFATQTFWDSATGSIWKGHFNGYQYYRQLAFLSPKSAVSC
jgi:hypothetical protein